MKLNRHILAIDPGFRHTGYVVYSLALKKIVASGCIHTEKLSGMSVCESNFKAIAFTVASLRTIIGEYPVTKVVAELQVGSSKSQKAAMAMGISFGTVISFCCSLGLTLVAVTPHQVKRMVSSKGSVSKQSVIRKFVSVFGNDWLSKRKAGHEHIADAGMVLLSYLRNSNNE